MKRILCFVFSVLFCFSSLIAEPKNADKPLPSGPKPKDRPSVALVLAGGGAKGFAHLPVIEMIEEVGIPIDMVVGTSIGSIIGGLYSAGYSTQEILNGFDNIDWSTMFLDNAQSPYEGTLNDYSLNRNIFVLNFGDDFSIKLGKGLSSGQNVYQLLKNMTLKYPSDTDFNNLTIPFRAVATDMLTGEALVLDEGDLAEAIRASMSLPSIFEPAEVDGHYFMDGGIRYNLAINVAKNMGYDIIIAVDISQKIRDNPEVYSSTPAVAMLNTITISQYTATQAMYKDASLVIIPDISNYGTLDFKNAQKIYDEGKKIRETYMPELEKLRRKIFPSDYDSAGNRLSKMDSVKKRGNYRRRSNLIPTEIEINGALERDKPFIYNSFKAIYDEELTPENFEPFMKKIYMTGNYTSVRPRIYERDDATVLSLNLKQKDKREEKIVVGAEMVQTVAPTMMSVFNLKLQAQIRGLTGPSSVLAVAGTAINDFGAELYYLQPFNPYFFMAAGAEYMDKRYPQMPVSLDNFKFMETSFSTYRTFDSNLCFGFRTDNGNLLRLEGYYNYRRTSTLASLYDELEYYVLIHDDLYKDGIRQPENWDPEFLRLDDEYITFLSDGVYVRSAGVLADYEFDHMDRYSFAHSGIYLNAIADLQFAFNTYVTDPALCLSLDIKDAIPLGKHISINTSLFAGMDVLDNIRKDVRLKLAAGFNRFDRVFFPQYTDESHFGAIKAACEVSIQIEPWSKLTILGGDAIIRLNGTFGNVVNSWDQFIPVTKKDSKIYPLCWTASAGFGVKFKEGYDLYLRVGAASNQKIDYTSDDVTKVIPFFALDLGSVKF